MSSSCLLSAFFFFYLFIFVSISLSLSFLFIFNTVTGSLFLSGFWQTVAYVKVLIMLVYHYRYDKFVVRRKYAWKHLFYDCYWLRFFLKLVSDASPTQSVQESTIQERNVARRNKAQHCLRDYILDLSYVELLKL